MVVLLLKNYKQGIHIIYLLKQMEIQSQFYVLKIRQSIIEQHIEISQLLY